MAVICMTTKPRSKRALSIQTITEKPSKYNSFDPSRLPDQELSELWGVAARKGLSEICEQIEAEKHRRAEKAKDML